MARNFAGSSTLYRAAHIWRRGNGELTVIYEGPYEVPGVAKGMVTKEKRLRLRHPNKNYVDSFLEEGHVAWNTAEVEDVYDQAEQPLP